MMIGIIGMGNMGKALLEAVSSTDIDIATIAIADKQTNRLKEIRLKFGCHVSTLEKIAIQAKNVLLVVKPQDIDVVLEEVGKLISPEQRVISFAAGKSTSSIEKYLNLGVPVLRVMPNTPMSVGVGASAISGGKNASSSDIKAVEDFLRASGKTIVVDESLQDAVTATSGSGPAYFFRFVEAMINGARALGLSESDARTLVIQTITGAAAMLNVEGASPSKLRENVTSPNGTTFAALQVFESMDIEGIIKKAMRAARDRSQELS